MFGRRWIGLAIALLLAVVVISSVGGAAQRNAWMQGYMAGRLASGAEGTAALAPYMMPGSPFMPSYGGFGAGGGLLIAFGFLALGFFFIGRRAHHHRRRYGNREEWAERLHQEMRRWHEQRNAEQNGAPWDRRPDDQAAGEEPQQRV